MSDFSTLNDSACQQVQIYTGEVCREELTALQACYSGMTTSPPQLSIPTQIDQEEGEKNALLLVNGLSFFNPSPECRRAITPFICLFIFTLCDSDSRLHTILRGDCLELRDNICAAEWSQALAVLPTGTLPICEDLLESTEECIGKCVCPCSPMHASKSVI